MLCFMRSRISTRSVVYLNLSRQYRMIVEAALFILRHFSFASRVFRCRVSLDLKDAVSCVREWKVKDAYLQGIVF